MKMKKKLNELKELSKSLNVIYVEDEPAVIEEVGTILKHIFPNIEFASDGHEAVEKFSKKIDLVITDILMPNKNGIEMIGEMKKIKEDIFVIVISGSNDSKYLSDMIELGVNAYLLKPLTFTGLTSALFNIVKKINEKLENRKYLIELQNSIDEKTLQLQQKYHLDELTGLRNRNSLFEDIKKFKPYALLLLDINNFSGINDLYGNEAGDDVLKEVTKKLIDIKSSCVLYKISADQFVFLKLDDSETNCEKYIKQIQSQINDSTVHLTVGDLEVEIFISTTVAVAIDVQSEKLFEAADLALHYAKKTNQNYVVYNEEMTKKINSKKTFDAIKMIKKAFQEDRVVPFFQPIFKENEITYECLVRILDDNNKTISPYFFLNEIKGTSFYTKLTQTMIEKSFKYFSSREYSFSINLSFEDISNKNIIDYLKEQLQRYRIEKRLIIEILESESIENFQVVKDFIFEMKSLGVQIAIDDFGSGYSNFSYLLELDPDFIKIDGSIIKNIAHDEKSFTVTKTIVNFSKELGIKTIAEFISNEDILKKLEELEIEGKQGYYLGEPKIDIEN